MSKLKPETDNRNYFYKNEKGPESAWPPQQYPSSEKQPNLNGVNYLISLLKNIFVGSIQIIQYLIQVIYGNISLLSIGSLFWSCFSIVKKILFRTFKY